MAPVASKRKKTLPPLVCALRCSSTPAAGSAQRRVLFTALGVLRLHCQAERSFHFENCEARQEWVSEMVQIINGMGRS
jgi:hypothetical protein